MNYNNNYSNYYNNNYPKKNFNNYNNYNNSNDFENNYRPNNEQNKLFNSKIFNNYMNNRLVSPEILISKNRNRSSINKNSKRFVDMPLSPYLQSKFIFKNPINKNNSVINMTNNKKNNKFPSINQHNLAKNASSSNIDIDNINDINLNFIKTNTIFNYQPKNNIFIPIVSNKRVDSIKSAHTQKLKNNNIKTTEISSPLSNEHQNKLIFDIKSFHNLKKGTHDKGYGKHYGNEKECPICQSILMKNNYLMKNMNPYNDIIKMKDNERIKSNKEQFLQDLKKPNSKIQKEEANIIRQIRYFLNSSKKANNNENNNANDEGNVINAYFGV